MFWLLYVAGETGILWKFTGGGVMLLLLALAAMLGPLIHFFISTSRTVHDVRGAAVVRQVRERIALRNRLRSS